MIYQLPNLGHCEHRFQEGELDFLWKEIKRIQEHGGQTHNEHLAGNIAEQYALIESMSELERLIAPHVEELENAFLHAKKYQPSVPAGLKLSEAWVNFQKKGEYNPVHDHSGAYSFIIWLKIPFSKHDEFAMSIVNPEKNRNGCVDFIYQSIVGETITFSMRVDKTSESGMVLFSSRLSHVVYPFFSTDEVRISVSGNFKFFPFSDSFNRR